jgi:aminopeptidase N
VAVAVAVVVLIVRSDDGDGDAAPTTTTVAETATSTTGSPPVVGAAGAAGVGDPYFPGLGNGGYDVDHYDLALTWRPDDGAIDGVTTIAATALQDLSRFNLDLSGLEVQSVTVDGAAAQVDHVERELEVTPATAIASGSEFTTVVTYRGRPEPISEGTDLFDVGWQTDGREAFVVSEPAGAATFFPVNDHPSDKATYTIEVTAPADQVVAANGLLAGTQDLGDGTKVWTYEESQPMASYLVQIAIGDYLLVDDGEVGGVRIRHAFHRAIGGSGPDLVEATTSMIDVLDDVWGPFPFDAYGVLVVDEPLGFALETQTLTIIGTDIAAEGSRAADVLVHELAHQWVGDAVSPATWKDIWLNEGFATYSEWLWTERTGGASAATRAREANGRGLNTAPGDPGTQELFQRSVYLRGGQTLQALREAIGDPAFFTVLRTWIDEHRGGSASTEQLVELAERVSGQQLDDLFQRWLYDPFQPTLR